MAQEAAGAGGLPKSSRRTMGGRRIRFSFTVAVERHAKSTAKNRQSVAISAQIATCHAREMQAKASPVAHLADPPYDRRGHHLVLNRP